MSKDTLRVYKNSNADLEIDVVMNLTKQHGFVFSAFRGIESVTFIMKYKDAKEDERLGTYPNLSRMKSNCEALILAAFGYTYSLPDFYSSITDVILTSMTSADGFLSKVRPEEDVQLYGYSFGVHSLSLSGSISREHGFSLKVNHSSSSADLYFPDMLVEGFSTLRARCTDIASNLVQEDIDLSDSFYYCIIYQSMNKVFTKAISMYTAQHAY